MENYITIYVTYNGKDYGRKILIEKNDVDFYDTYLFLSHLSLIFAESIMRGIDPIKMQEDEVKMREVGEYITKQIKKIY